MGITTSEIIYSAHYPYLRGCKQCGKKEEYMLMKTKEVNWMRGDDEVLFLCREHSSKKTWTAWENENNKRKKRAEKEQSILNERAMNLIKSSDCLCIEKDYDGDIIITVRG